MKRPFRILLAFLIAFAASGIPALGSVTCTATFTADNVVGAFYHDGSLPVLVDGFAGLSNLSNWEAAKTLTFTLPSEATTVTYDLVFRVENLSSDLTFEKKNYGTMGNPAGFLAQINVSGYNVLPTQLLSGVNGVWQYADDTNFYGSVVSGDLLISNPNLATLTWQDVTSWGYKSTDTYFATGQPYNGGDNIWNQYNGPITGISSGSSGAQWVWDGTNGTHLGNLDGSPTQDDFLFIRTQITVPPVPEPVSLIIWSLLAVGGLGVTALRRRSARKA